MELSTTRNHDLRARLNALLAWKSDYATQAAINVVITTNEINDRHGTGVLLKRILDGRRNVFSIRSRDDWGDPQFGDWNIRLPRAGLNRPEGFRNVLRLLGGRHVKSVLCVPFLIDEPMVAIAIQEIFGARLCAYMMDDQNIASAIIPDILIREYLERSSLRLATHPELRVAYERKYEVPFFLLPAVVPDALILRHTLPPLIAYDGKIRGALIGNFWDQSWFDRLCVALKPSGVSIDWYGNHQSPFVKFSEKKLAAARITSHGIVPEEQLALALRDYPFVIVPTGTFDPSEKNQSVASLSLPGRIPFTAAVSQTPVLVVGSTVTCGSRFVKHFGIGETVAYDAAEIKAAIGRLCDPKAQREMRSNAARIGPGFSDRGVVAWLEKSIELGHAADTRFEEAFAGYPAD